MNLITGATGLVGAHLALRLLQQGKPVAAIRRAGSDIQKTRQLFAQYKAEALFERIDWRDADICDIYSLLDAFDGVETVYHCAGFVSFVPTDRALIHRINAEGTANVVNACLEKRIAYLVHASSIATLQNPDIKTNINETVYWKSSPRANDYAISKYNAEREVWRGIEEGLHASIVNPGVIIGPGFWNQGSGKLIPQLYKNSTFYTKGMTGYVDVRDVASIMAELGEKRPASKRYVLVEGSYSFKTVFTEICKAIGRKAPGIQAGTGLLWLGRMADRLRSWITGSPRVLTKAIANASLDRHSYDSSLVQRELNYQFIPFNDSIRFACASFLDHRSQRS